MARCETAAADGRGRCLRRSRRGRLGPGGLGHGGGLADPALTAPIPGARCDQPSDILDLSGWKLQAAASTPRTVTPSPLEITAPGLVGKVITSVFEVMPGCEAVVFSAGVDGATTGGSAYPRSELREMTGGGAEAGWSSTSGVHILVVTEAFTRLPNTKPHLVGAQIHDGQDDISTFRLEGTRLYITEGDNANAHLIDPDYVLGTPFEAKYVVSGGKVRAYYNGVLKATIPSSFTGGYFKVGAYTQANCGNSTPCAFGNYGQVAVVRLSVTHTASPGTG